MSAQVLCVDDIPDNLLLLTDILEYEGYSVIQAKNGEEALEIVEKQTPDAILLDVMMPGISGLQVLEDLRKTHSQIELPIIMVTALSEVGDIVRALNLGANDYVTKPLDLDIVLARLETHLKTMQLNKERNKLSQMREEFMAIASHDLRNPLGNILGLAELLSIENEQSQENREETAEFLRLIIEAAQKMYAIIEDFIDVEDLEQGQLKLSRKDVNVPELVQAAIKSQEQYALSKSISLQSQRLNHCPLVSADPAKLSQVLDNFLSNAIKYSPQNTEVLVQTLLDDSCVKVKVIDAGPGLTQEDQENAFQKYARLSNKPTGKEKSLGLGLFICRRLIEAHQGTIGVENNDEQGATFWFSLPLSPRLS